jgi:hypothetical protein
MYYSPEITSLGLYQIGNRYFLITIPWLLQKMLSKDLILSEVTLAKLREDFGKQVQAELEERNNPK